MSILQYQNNQSKTELDKVVSEPAVIHIWRKKRNGRKYWTIIEGLTKTEEDVNKICKELRNKLCCGGAVKEDDKTKEDIIQLQGDKVDKVKEFLTTKKIVTLENIKCHG